MKNSYENDFKKISVAKKTLLAVCTLGFLSSLLLFVPPIQKLILDFGEHLIGRSLTRHIWVERFIEWGVQLCLLFVCIAIYSICIEKSIAETKIIAKKISDFFCKNERIFFIVSLSIFFTINIFSIIFHEHWCDEAQSWLIAKYSSPLDLFRILPNERHPALFYLILMPFAKLGFPFKYLSFITFAFVFVAAILFLRYFKAHPLFKIILLFTPIFTFIPGVIARSYCLLTLELVVIACFYERRNKLSILWGITIALMLQTHIYLTGLCGMLMIQMLFECIKEKDKKIKMKILFGGIIATISLIFLLIELGIGKSNASNDLISIIINPVSFVKQAFGQLKNLIKHWAYTGGKCEAFFCCLILFFAILKAVLNFKKCVWEFFILLGTIFELVIVKTIYSGAHMNHRVAVFSIFALCIYLLEKATASKLILCSIEIERMSESHPKKFKRINLDIIKNVIFVLMLLSSCKMVFRDFVIKDIRHPFSNSKAMANYINKNFDDKCNFVINDYKMINCTISAYLNSGKYLIHPSDGSKFDFLHIGHNRNEHYDLWKEENSPKPTFYLFVSEPYVGNELELVHSENADCYVSNEKMFLYKKRAKTQ